MVRAANTGVSCFIDASGRITARLADPSTGSSFVEGCLPGEIAVPLHPPTTFYARHGDAFSLSLLLLCVTTAGLQTRRHRRA